MTRTLALLAIAAVLLWPVRVTLLRSRWTDRAPRAAIALWQALGCAIAMALIGGIAELALMAGAPRPAPRRPVTDFSSHLLAAHPQGGLSPGELFALTAGLIVATLVLGGLATRAVDVLHRRARRRLLIDLVGTTRAEFPGALVLEHPDATAFSLPGLRPRVVVSRGAIDALDAEELAAVLAHEQAHVRARHDLVLLPFRALTDLFPHSRALARMYEELADLVELAADDAVLRECEPTALARALCRLATVSSPSLSSVSRPGSTARRVERALEAPERSRLAASCAAFSAACALALPLAALVLPLGGR